MTTDSSGLSSGGSRIQNTALPSSSAAQARGGSILNLPQSIASQSSAQSLLGRIVSAPNPQGVVQVDTAQGKLEVQLSGNKTQNAQFQAGRSVQVNIDALSNSASTQNTLRQASISLAADKIAPNPQSQNASSQSNIGQGQNAQRSVDTSVPYPSRYDVNTQAQSRAQNPAAQNQTTQLAQGQAISTQAATPQQVRAVPPLQTQAQATQLPPQNTQAFQPPQSAQQSQQVQPQQAQAVQGQSQNTANQTNVTVERPVLPVPASTVQAAQPKPQLAAPQTQGSTSAPTATTTVNSAQPQGQIQPQNIQDIPSQYVRQNFATQPSLSNFSVPGGSVSNTAQAIVQALYSQPLSALQTALGADSLSGAAPSLQANIAGQFQNLVQQIQRSDPLSKLFAHRFIGAQGGALSSGNLGARASSTLGQGGFSLSALQSALQSQSGSTIQQAGQQIGATSAQQTSTARLTPFQNLSVLTQSLINSPSSLSPQAAGGSQAGLSASSSLLQSGAGSLSLNNAGAALDGLAAQGRFGQMITAAGQGVLLDVRVQNIANSQAFQISNFAQNVKGDMQNALIGQGGALSKSGNQAARQFTYGQSNNALSPQGQNTSTGSLTQNMSTSSPFMARFGQVSAASGQLFGMITGVNAAGQMIMSLSDGVSRFSGQYVLPQNIKPLRSGTVLTLDVLQARVAGPQGQAVGPVFKGLNGFFQAMGYADQGWGDLQESFDILRSKLSPDDMQATLRAIPTVATSASGVEAGMRLSSQILFFIAALKGGDISNWLGERNSNTLKAERGGALFARMARGFEGLSRGLSEASTVQNGEWRSASIPTFFGADLSKLNMHIRDYFHDGLSDDEMFEKPDKRFVIDFSLSRMGEMQIDSLMTHPAADGVRRLETVLRTQESLGSDMRQELRQKYSAVMRGVGYHGYLDFQALGGTQTAAEKPA